MLFITHLLIPTCLLTRTNSECCAPNVLIDANDYECYYIRIEYAWVYLWKSYGISLLHKLICKISLFSLLEIINTQNLYIYTHGIIECNSKNCLKSARTTRQFKFWALLNANCDAAKCFDMSDE